MAEESRLVNALKRLTIEVHYMLQAPTKDLIISAETQLALTEAVRALEGIGESIAEEDD